MTTTSVASATKIVGRRIFDLLRHSAAPSAGRSKSASMNCPRNEGRCDGDATLISRLLLTDQKHRRPITETIMVAIRLKAAACHPAPASPTQAEDNNGSGKTERFRSASQAFLTPARLNRT